MWVVATSVHTFIHWVEYLGHHPIFTNAIEWHEKRYWKLEMKKTLLSGNENKISNGGEKQNRWNTTLATRERPSILRLMSY